jgi:hypothetical protein
VVGKRKDVVLVAPHIMINEVAWIDLAVVKVWHAGDIVKEIEIKADNGKTYKLIGEMKMEIT